MAHRKKTDDVADASPKMQVKNYVYGAKSVVDGGCPPRADGKTLVDDQIYHVHRYKNALIAIELERRKATHAVISEFDSEIPRLEATIEEAEEAILSLKAGIKGRNQAIRKKSLATADERAQTKALKTAKREAAAELKARKATAYADPVVKARLAPIAEGAKRDNEGVYAESPAFWPSKSMVRDAFKDIGKGKPPRHRRWSLEGAIATQIQRGIPWSELLLCNHAWARLQILKPGEYRPTHSKSGRFLPEPDPDSKRSQKKKMGLLWIRIGTSDTGRAPVWAKVLVHIHREPPPDTLVKWVFLHRHLVGRQVKFNVRFALSRESWPSDRAAEDAGSIGVAVGWWPLDDGGMRVATATGDDGESVSLDIDEEDLGRWKHAASLRAIRDTNFNAAKEGLIAFKDACKKAGKSLPEWLSEEISDLHSWKSPDRLQRLAWRWKDERSRSDRMVIPEMIGWRLNHPKSMEKYGPEPMPLFDELEAWREQDRHLHDWEDSEREKAVRWRDDLYRKFVAGIRRAYRKAIIVGIDWAAAKKEADAGMKDHPEVRTVMQVIAPGTLQAFLLESFGKADVTKVAEDAVDGDTAEEISRSLVAGRSRDAGRGRDELK